MATRRQAREWALMMLTEFELNPPQDVESAIGSFWEQLEDLEHEQLENDEFGARAVFSLNDPHNCTSLENMKEFARVRVLGVLKDQSDIDDKIAPFLKNWPMYRLGTVERNVLRMGAWEILNCHDVPAAIAINEAVDVAKYFSETSSGRLVNGVLDSFARSLGVGEFVPVKRKSGVRSARGCTKKEKIEK